MALDGWSFIENFSRFAMGGVYYLPAFSEVLRLPNSLPIRKGRGGWGGRNRDRNHGEKMLVGGRVVEIISDILLHVFDFYSDPSSDAP